MDVTVPVPDERLAEFYEMFGRWLQGDLAPATDEGGMVRTPPRVENWTSDDADLAQELWDRLSEKARGLMSVLMDSPDTSVSGEKLAEMLDIDNGKYGVAGTLAWPGRHSIALGRNLPVRYRDGEVGESAQYWMDSQVAELFKSARQNAEANNA